MADSPALFVYWTGKGVPFSGLLPPRPRSPPWCVIVQIETDSPTRLTVGVQEKQTTTQSHNSYRRTVDNIVRHPFPEYMHLSHPDHIPFVSCHRITNPHCRSILRQASGLYRIATLHASKSINRNPHSSISHPPSMNSNLASHLHLSLKSIHV